MEKCKCGAEGKNTICPFSLEIKGEEVQCTCCEDCEHQCAMDI